MTLTDEELRELWAIQDKQHPTRQELDRQEVLEWTYNQGEIGAGNPHN